MTAQHLLLVGAVLFCSGLYLILTKKNSIFVLIGVELMLNAANINFIVFGQNDPTGEGNIAALLVMVLAAIEAAIALAIIFKVYRYYQTTDLSEMNDLKD
jgi:NADH:ubiquinone oxidoreductase subunit K